MIPKVIHYCWFGRNPLPSAAKQCIESWHKFLPDYEIKEWNENNFDIHITPFVYEAYKLKKWAFVSDYARFWILYNYGGVYFDTDVEVINRMDDVLERGPFMGCEAEWDKPGMRIAAGLGLGAYPRMDVYRDVLNIYNNLHIIDKKGTMHLPCVVDIVTDYFEKLGAVKSNEIVRYNDIDIYPPEYFCPKNYGSLKMNITENTKSIHHYEASWLKPTFLEICEIPFWNFFHQSNHQILWRIKNLFIRWSY